MPTLVLSRRYSDDSNAVWRAAVEMGWDVERLQSYSAPDGLVDRDPVLYGETLMADAVAETLGLTLLEPRHDWLPRLPARYLSRRVSLATLGEFRTVSERAFVKPVDEKIFPAGVYDAGATIDERRVFDDASPVLVSEPVRFGLEVRAFVCDREVVAHSAYMRDGDIARNAAGEWAMTGAEDEDARAFLAELVTDPAVELPPAAVIDVGALESGGWAVVESNACWASGVCGCDPRAVLRAVRRANVRELSAADAPWSRAAHMTA